MDTNKKKKTFPAQEQPTQPGIESEMHPEPIYDNSNYIGSRKLWDKVALITGGDSGIGRSVALHFAKEGADIAIIYLDESNDAKDAKSAIEEVGRKCLCIPGDITDEEFCRDVVKRVIDTYGKIDVLVNNAAMQFPQKSILDISKEQLELTFRTNIFPMFYLTKAVLPHFKKGCTIVNTASITAYKGHKTLIDYSATKGAVVTFTRSLALSLVDEGIRVNAVAPGPVWTPLIPASMSRKKVSTFGSENPTGHAAQPFELAPAYVYLASDDSSYVTGTTIHVNGGAMVTS